MKPNQLHKLVSDNLLQGKKSELSASPTTLGRVDRRQRDMNNDELDALRVAALQCQVIGQLQREIRAYGHGRGTVCHVCRRQYRIEKRTLYYTMALFLLELARQTKSQGIQWFRSESIYQKMDENGIRYMKKGRTRGRPTDHTKLRFWGFLEIGRRRDKRSGYVRITDRGLEFAAGQLLAPKYVKHVGNEVFGFLGPDVDIDAVLKIHWDNDTFTSDDPE